MTIVTLDGNMMVPKVNACVFYPPIMYTNNAKNVHRGGNPHDARIMFVSALRSVLLERERLTRFGLAGRLIHGILSSLFRLKSPISIP